MKVAILLCTLRGQHYLAEQLQSLSTQTFPHWEVFASDDGSEDDTQALLRRYQAQWPQSKLTIHSGPAEGFAANFLSLICNAGIQADYYAFADQDDVWEPTKLERAVAWLATIPEDVPALYGSRTLLVNANNQVLGLSPLFCKPPCFSNALTQNIAGGNTMVFNDAARRLLQAAGDKIDVVVHDWWVYLVVSGCGGRVFYDALPSVRYRQHEQNVVGLDTGWRARLLRIQLSFNGRFKGWTDRNIAALERISTALTPENYRKLQIFKTARTRWLVPRLWGLLQAGIHRQSILSNIGLFMAAVFNKI
jgi:glycosyltransferase involved in cell wall biosynthesis